MSTICWTVPTRRPMPCSGSAACRTRSDLAKRVSPLEYVRAVCPDSDDSGRRRSDRPLLAFDASARCPVNGAECRISLLTIPNGKHGNFTPEERVKIYSDDPGVFDEVSRDVAFVQSSEASSPKRADSPWIRRNPARSRSAWWSMRWLVSRPVVMRKNA